MEVQTLEEANVKIQELEKQVQAQKELLEVRQSLPNLFGPALPPQSKYLSGVKEQAVEQALLIAKDKEVMPATRLDAILMILKTFIPEV